MKIRLFSLLAFAPLAAHAQIHTPTVQFVTTAPSGSCAQNYPLTIVMPAGAVYTCQNGTIAQISGSAGGTISSVGSIANVAASSTSSGAVTFTPVTEAANTVFAGPASGSTSTAPTWRSLVAADIPATLGPISMPNLTVTNRATSAIVAGTLGAAGAFVVNTAGNGSNGDGCFGTYDGGNSRYYGICGTGPAPSGWVALTGYYAGLGVIGASQNTGNPIFVVSNSGQGGYGVNSTAFTVTDKNLVATYNNTLDDANGNATIKGTVTSAIGAVSGTTTGTNATLLNVLSSGESGSGQYASNFSVTDSKRVFSYYNVLDDGGGNMTALGTVAGAKLSGVLIGATNTTDAATLAVPITKRLSYVALTTNTTFTLAAGADGQEITLCWAQGASTAYTVTAPTNVRGFTTIGSTLSKASCQHFSYSATATAWLADSPGVTNE